MKVCVTTVLPPCITVKVAVWNCTSVTLAVNGRGQPASSAVTVGAKVVTLKLRLPFLISVEGMVVEPDGETGVCCPGGLLPPGLVQLVDAVPVVETTIVTS